MCDIQRMNRIAFRIAVVGSGEDPGVKHAVRLRRIRTAEDDRASVRNELTNDWSKAGPDIGISCFLFGYEKNIHSDELSAKLPGIRRVRFNDRIVRKVGMNCRFKTRNTGEEIYPVSHCQHLYLSDERAIGTVYELAARCIAHIHVESGRVPAIDVCVKTAGRSNEDVRRILNINGSCDGVSIITGRG